MSTGFGLMNVQCHGSHTVFQVGYDGSIPGDGAVWTSDVYSNVWGTHAEANGALNDLTNISYPSLFYSISCQNASIDSFQTAQWPRRSVAEGYTVMSPSIGGPAFFGNTRYGLVGPSSSLLDEFDLLLKAGTVVDGQLPFHALELQKWYQNSFISIIFLNIPTISLVARKCQYGQPRHPYSQVQQLRIMVRL